MIGIFAGCGSKKDDKDKGEVLAEVGGETIYYNDAEDFAKTLLLLYSQYTWDEVPEEQRADIVKRSVLNVLIDDKIIRDYMKDDDVITSETKEQIKTGITNIKADETLGPQIIAVGITDEMIEKYFTFYFYTQAFMDKVNEDDPVTDEEIQKFYDENKDDPTMTDIFSSPATITASHILIADAEHGAEAKAKAEEALAKAKNGEDFAELAQEYSDDSTAADGGDLGEFAEGQMVPEFDAAAFNLKNGEISDIVETQYGYHIIKAYSDVTPAKEVKTVDEAREAILPLIQEEHVTKLIEELREKAKVKYVGGLEADDESLVPTEDAIIDDEIVEDPPTEETPEDENAVG
jgi:foldase protein PrsA